MKPIQFYWSSCIEIPPFKPLNRIRRFKYFIERLSHSIKFYRSFPWGWKVELILYVFRILVELEIYFKNDIVHFLSKINKYESCDTNCDWMCAIYMNTCWIQGSNYWISLGLEDSLLRCETQIIKLHCLCNSVAEPQHRRDLGAHQEFVNILTCSSLGAKYWRGDEFWKQILNRWTEQQEGSIRHPAGGQYQPVRQKWITGTGDSCKSKLPSWIFLLHIPNNQTCMEYRNMFWVLTAGPALMAWL